MSREDDAWLLLEEVPQWWAAPQPWDTLTDEQIAEMADEYQRSEIAAGNELEIPR